MMFSAVMWGPRQQAGSGAELERGIWKNVLFIVQVSSKGVAQRPKGSRACPGPVGGFLALSRSRCVPSLPGQWQCSRAEAGRLDLCTRDCGSRVSPKPGGGLGTGGPCAWGGGRRVGGPNAVMPQCFLPPECVLPCVLPAAALASGHYHTDSPSAVPTWAGAQPGELALHVGLSWED